MGLITTLCVINSILLFLLIFSYITQNQLPKLEFLQDQMGDLVNYYMRINEQLEIQKDELFLIKKKLLSHEDYAKNLFEQYVLNEESKTD